MATTCGSAKRLSQWTILDSKPTAISAGKQGDGSEGGTESGTLSGELLISDSRLVKLIEVWPTLGEDVKGEILRLAGYDVDDLTTEGTSAGEVVS